MFHRRGGQVTMINKELNAKPVRNCPQGCLLDVLWLLLVLSISHGAMGWSAVCDWGIFRSHLSPFC